MAGRFCARVDRIVHGLNERARCACEIGKIKKVQNVEVYQPEREKQVLDHVRSIAAEGPLDPEATPALGFGRLGAKA